MFLGLLVSQRKLSIHPKQEKREVRSNGLFLEILQDSYLNPGLDPPQANFLCFSKLVNQLLLHMKICKGHVPV